MPKFFFWKGPLNCITYYFGSCFWFSLVTAGLKPQTVIMLAKAARAHYLPNQVLQRHSAINQGGVITNHMSNACWHYLRGAFRRTVFSCLQQPSMCWLCSQAAGDLGLSGQNNPHWFTVAWSGTQGWLLLLIIVYTASSFKIDFEIGSLSMSWGRRNVFKTGH